MNNVYWKMVLPHNSLHRRVFIASRYLTIQHLQLTVGEMNETRIMSNQADRGAVRMQLLQQVHYHQTAG